MIDIITRESEWDDLLRDIEDFDFYHTFKYHYYNRKSGETPQLYVFRNKRDVIALPLLKRKVNEEYFDLTSVHGKVGPVCKFQGDPTTIEKFRFIFKKKLLDEKIVSVFCRLNPFIQYQAEILSGLGKMDLVGENMYFDQSEDPEVQFKNYHRSTRQNIRKLKKICEVRSIENGEQLNMFIEMHYRNMNRKKAKEEYFFTREYFKSMLDYDMINANIYFAIHKESNEIMAGHFSVITNRIVESEIGWTVDKYRKFSPMALLWDEERERSRRKGIEFINLGGGPGGREGSVMEAKRRFTEKYIDFYHWKLISNPPVYNSLLSEKQKSTDCDFFPKYRLLV